MAIISTFDPKFQKQILSDCINEFWKENVVHIRKSKLFLWWFVVLPFLLWFITLTVILFWIIYFIPWKYVWLIVALCIIVVLFWIKPWTKILKYYLDYCMDFSIVTPQSFIRYDQTWFFKRTSKIIDLIHIRSVSVEKKWFINSLFNNWNIVILSEWSDNTWWDPKADSWKIIFRYVKDPDKYWECIQHMLKNVNYD